VALSVILILFITLFTIVNIFYYGSIVQINVPILSLVLVIPLYLAFKYKMYTKKMLLLLGGFLSLIMIWTLLLFPKYTYNEAVEIISKEDEPLKIQIIRRHGPSNFFYAGDYSIKTKNNVYSFNFKTGKYKVVD